MSEIHEVCAIRYATVMRRRQDNFLEPVDEPDRPMALDFFVWLVHGHGTVLLVDTGFSAVSALARKREFLATPMESLERLGFPPDRITDVAITHLHYDHAGNLDAFPNARLWVQDREVRFATGRCMCEPRMNHFFAARDIGTLTQRLYAGDVRLIDGMHRLRDGIELHRVGGHTDGLQVVRVRSRAGWLVLASDAAHYYENLATANPFPAIFDVDDMRAGYRLIRELADGESNIVPGHDPEVCERYRPMGIPGVHAYAIA